MGGGWGEGGGQGRGWALDSGLQGLGGLVGASAGDPDLAGLISSLPREETILDGRGSPG